MWSDNYPPDQLQTNVIDNEFKDYSFNELLHKYASYVALKVDLYLREMTFGFYWNTHKKNSGILYL